MILFHNELCYLLLKHFMGSGYIGMPNASKQPKANIQRLKCSYISTRVTYSNVVTRYKDYEKSHVMCLRVYVLSLKTLLSTA